MNEHLRNDMKLTTLIILFIAVLAANVTAQAPQKAANFTLKDVNGKYHSLSSSIGKVVLLNFWATWCGPCKREIPDLIALYSKYKKKGVEFLAISLDEKGAEVVVPFVKQNKMNFPVLLGGIDVVRDYGGFNSIPTTFMIDKKGMIRKTLVGMQTKTEFEKEILALLKK